MKPKTAMKRLKSHENKERNFRYSFRKFKVGLASVAVAAVFLGRSAINVQASELLQSEDTTVATEVLEVEDDSAGLVQEDLSQLAEETVETSPLPEMVEAVAQVTEVTNLSAPEEPTESVEEIEVKDEVEEVSSETETEQETVTDSESEEVDEEKVTSKEDKSEQDSSKKVAEASAVEQVLEQSASEVNISPRVQKVLYYDDLAPTTTVTNDVPVGETVHVETDLEETAESDFDNAYTSQLLSDDIRSAESLGELDSLRRSLRSLNEERAASDWNLSQLFDDDAEEDTFTLLNARPGNTVQANTLYSQDIFTIGTEYIDATLDEGRFVGAYQDRQDLGAIIRAGATVQIRQTNPNYSDNLTLRMWGNDAEKESFYLVGESWVTVSAPTDLVMFIDTPVVDNAVNPTIEWRLTAGAATALPIYESGNNANTFFNQWNSSGASYALVKGKNVQMLVPMNDLNALREANPEQVLALYDDKIFPLFDKLTGIPTNTNSNQPTKGRYFIKSNISEVGAFSNTYTSNYTNSVSAFFTDSWQTLNEIAYWYEIDVVDSTSTMPVSEVMNRIYSTFYQQNYQSNFETTSSIFRNNKEGIVNSLYTQITEQGTPYLDLQIRDELILLLSLANYRGQDSFEAFNNYHRQMVRHSEDYIDFQGIWLKFFGDHYGVDAGDYFETLGIDVDLAIKQNNYNKQPAVTFLANVVPEDKLASVMQQLGWTSDHLKNKLSLVKTSELAVTGLQSNIKLTIDNASDILGKTLQIMDGSKIVKTVTVAEGEMDLGTLPNGIYSYRIADDSKVMFSDNYLYVKEDSTVLNHVHTDAILSEIANLFTDETYTRLKDDVVLASIQSYQYSVETLEDEVIKASNLELIDKALSLLNQWDLYGLDNLQFAKIRHLNDDFELIVTTEYSAPHIYYNNAYASIKVLNPDGSVEYSKDWIGSTTYEDAEDRVALQPGSLIYITHREPNDIRFSIHPLEFDTERTSPEVYIVLDDGSIIPYPGESRENGVLVQTDKLGFPILFLLGNGTAVSKINDSNAGMQSYPLTKEEFDNVRGWTNDVTGPIAAIQAGYGYEQGEEVDIDMNARFELSDFAKASGYEIVSITPGNLPGGLYYDTETGHIRGAIKDDLENFSMRLTAEIVVSNGEETFTWSSSNIGAIIWKDTKGPTIKTTDKVVGIGEEVVIDFVARDENGKPSASAEESAEFYVLDGAWTLPLPAGSVSFNDYYGRENTAQIQIAADSLNSEMGLTFRYSLTGNNFSTGLPEGLSYDSQTGKLAGTPTTAGTYYIEVTATDFESTTHPQRTTTNWRRLVSPTKSTAVFTLTVADQAYVYEPQGLTKEVPKEAVVTAEEMIGNVADLPEGTTFEFTRVLNTSTAGRKNMSVKVSYPDSSSELVPVTVVVLAPMDETYRPLTQRVTVSRGETIEASAFITNIADLPEGTVFSFVTEPDTSELMLNRTQTILVSYPDQTSETVTARLTVTEAQQITYEPATKTQVLYRGDSIDAKNSLANPSAMPLDAKYSFEPEVDTNVLGYHTFTLVVTYSDGTQDRVPAPIHIYEDQKDTYEPIPQVQTVKKGTEVKPRDSVANASEMPGRTTYTFLTPVDTSTVGTKTTTVRVTYYVDETYDDIEVEIIVVPFDNETITPEAKNQTVVRGTSLTAEDFIGNLSSLPQNTQVSFVDQISTAELGEFPVNLLVTYPDSTTANVAAKLTVYEYDNDRYTPVAQTQTVEKNTTVDAKDSISNTTALPATSQYSFVTAPDISRAGTVTTVVRVTYPDKTEDLVPVTIVVTEPNSDTYQPQTKAVSIFTNETVEASDFVTNSNALPMGTSFSLETAPDTSKSGTQNLTLIATYPDQSSDKVTVELTVKPRQNELYEPTTQDLTVAKGTTPVAADAVTNQTQLPDNTEFSFKSNVNTQTAGTRFAVVVTTYPDGTQDETRIRIVVTEPQADTYRPIGGEITVGYQQPVPVADLITNKAELPAATSYSLLDTVDTTKEGRHAVTVLVTYPDKSEEMVSAVVRVVDDRPDAEKYQPAVTTQTVSVNTVVDANLSIANLADLPAGTKANFVANLDTSTAGTKTATISVLYPDGTTDNVTARVVVTDNRTDAEKYQPVTRDQIVNLGDNVVASRSVTNFARLPIGTRVSFTQTVDTSTGGDKPADILISYPDGSTEKVSVTITVLDNRTDAEKYEPIAHDTTVSINDEIAPASLITNLSSLPSTATISFVSKPDTSTVAIVEAVIQVTYADGTKDNLTVKITVVDDRPDASKYPAQTQVQEVDYYFGKAEPTANVANWSALPAGTKAEYVTEPDVMQVGEQTKVLKLSYPDGSTNYYDVVIRVVDNSKQTDWNDPKTVDRTVEVGETILAQESISNRADLPQGTNFAFATPVDTSREGEQTVTVIVTYPDQSQDKVSAKVTVVHRATQAETYPAQAQSKEIALGTSLKATDFISNLTDLPADSQITFAQTPVWDKLGTQTVNLLVAYPDGSHLNLSTALTVLDTRTDAEREEPVGKVQTIEISSQPQPEQSLTNLSNLPKGTSVSYVEPINSSQEGSYQAQLQVIYPDKSSEVILVEIKVVDSRSQADRYEPVGKDITVEAGMSVSAADLLSNASSLPNDAVVSFVAQPDTTKVGTVPADLRVTYADGSVDSFTAQITVTAKTTQSDRYEPVGKDITVEAGTSVSAADLLSNASSLPNDAAVSFVVQPDTTKVGTVPAELLVTYADGSVDSFTAQITVTAKPTQSDRYEPVGKDITVEVGTSVSAADLLSNASSLPNDAVVSFVAQPDTTKVGTVPAELLVTYADGSVDQVAVTITVIVQPTDAELYPVETEDLVVGVNSQVDALSFISNYSDLPRKTLIRYNSATEVTDSQGRLAAMLRSESAYLEAMSLTNLLVGQTDLERVSLLADKPGLYLMTFEVDYPDNSTNQVSAYLTVLAPPSDTDKEPVVRQVTEEQAYETRYQANAQVEADKRTVLVAGQTGLLQLTYTDNRLTASETLRQVIDEVIEVGTKSKENRQTLTYQVMVEEDANLFPAESYTKQVGQDGELIETTTYTLDTKTGQLTAQTTTSRRAPVNEIQVLGTKTQVTRRIAIPYETRYEADDTHQAGTRQVLVAGQDGILTQTIINGILSSEERSQEPVTEVIRVGTKEEVASEKLVFITMMTYDDSLYPEESYVKVVGQDGVRETRTSYQLDTKTGELTATKTVHQVDPIEEVRVVGTREVQITTQEATIAYDTRYEADDSLDADQRYVKVAGQDGLLVRTYLDGVFSSEVVSRPAVTEIIIVGTKPLVEEEALDFDSQTRHDDTLLLGQSYIEQVGRPGRRVTTTTYSLDAQTGLLSKIVSSQVQEPVTEIIVQGSRELVTTSQDKVDTHKTLYEADSKLTAGEKVVKQAGQDGITRFNYVDGVLTSQTVVQVLIDEIVLVGTKAEEDIQMLAFKHLVEEDKDLLPEESYIKQAGQRGRQVTLTSYSLDAYTGELTPTVQVSTISPVDEILVRGTKSLDKVVTELPFSTIYQSDTNLAYGQTKILVAGQVGQLTKLLVNGQVSSEEVTVPVVDQIIAVGTQTSRQLLELPYEHQVEYADHLLPEESYIKQAGQTGVLEVLVTYTLDENTGQVTANRQEKRTEPQAEIRIVGTKNQELLLETVDFEIRYQADDSLAYGQTKILIAGQAGQLTKLLVNGQVSSEELTIPAIHQLVAVGTQASRQLLELPYERQVEYADHLLPEESYVKQAGQVGFREVLVTYTLDENTGQVTANRQESVTQPQAEIRVVGTKNQENVLETIDFAVRYQADDSLAYGQTKVLVVGQAGRQKLLFENGQLISRVIEVEPVTQLVAVGSQPTVTELVLPYLTETKTDENLPVGQEVEHQAGQDGRLVTRITYQVDELTGQVTSDTKSERIEPVTRVLVKGIGENKEIPYAIRYVADDQLAYGQREIRQAGQSGLMTVAGEILSDSQEEIIAVGTKTSVIERLIAFTTERIDDQQLPQGEEKILVAGKNGLEREITTYQVDEITGQVSAQTRLERTDPQAEVIAVGKAIMTEKPVEQPTEEPEEPTQPQVEEPVKEVVEPEAPIEQPSQEEPVQPSKGVVIVRYLDKEGNPLRPEVIAIESSVVGYPYDEDDFTDKRLTEFVASDGKRYALAPSLIRGEIGVVAEGISYVDYIYLEVVEDLPPTEEQSVKELEEVEAVDVEVTPVATKPAKPVAQKEVLSSVTAIEVASETIDEATLPNTGSESSQLALIGLLATSLGLVALRRRDDN